MGWVGSGVLGAVGPWVSSGGGEGQLLNADYFLSVARAGNVSVACAGELIVGTGPGLAGRMVG